MKVLKLALCAAAASFAMAGAAAAQDVAFNFGVANDYAFRGLSQTDEKPQAFAGADVTSGIFYAGTWASNVDFGDGTDAEIDFYAGVTPTLGIASLNLGVIYYGYLGNPGDSNWEMVELKAAGSVPVGPATLGLAFYYSPEFTGETGTALYSEFNAAYSPMEKLTFGGAVGQQEVEDADDYMTWNLGATYALTDVVSVDVRYHDTDIDACDLCDARGIVTLKAAF